MDRKQHKRPLDPLGKAFRFILIVWGSVFVAYIMFTIIR